MLRPTFRVGILLAVLALMVSSCSSPTGPSGGGTFTAVVDGTHFAASSGSATANGSSTTPGFVSIRGTQITSSTNTATISITLGFVTGTGTYPLGVNFGMVAGGLASVETTLTTTVKDWSTDIDGAAGTITITKLTSTEIAGTFQFNAPRVVSQSGPNTSVTNGQFDVPLSGFVIGSTSDPGSLFKITSLNGSAFTGATIVFQGTASSFGLAGNSSKTVNGSPAITQVTLLSTGTIVPGSFPIASPPGGGAFISITVVTPTSIFGGQPGDSGTVTITSNSGGRLKGTFSGNLVGGMSVAGGSFDVKISGS